MEFSVPEDPVCHPAGRYGPNVRNVRASVAKPIKITTNQKHQTVSRDTMYILFLATEAV